MEGDTDVKKQLKRLVFLFQRFRGKVDKDGWDRNFAIVISDDDDGGGDNFVTPSVDANDDDAVKNVVRDCYIVLSSVDDFSIYDVVEVKENPLVNRLPWTIH